MNTKKILIRAGIAVIVFAAIFVFAASVKWTNDGVKIANPVSGAVALNLKSCGDGTGGAYVVWEDSRSGNKDIYIRRVDTQGNPMWAADGVAVCNASLNQTQPQVVNDGMGGAIVSWVDARGTSNDVYAQKIDPAGNPVWSPGGVTISAAANGQTNIDMIPDGLGGAIIVWTDARGGAADTEIYVQKVIAAGTMAWTADGVAITSGAANNQDRPRLVSDGVGGAIITWHDYRVGVSDADIYARLINSAGTVQWTANGVSLCTLAGSDQLNPVICSNGTGGAIVVWEDGRDSGYTDLYARRISAGGTASWGVASGLAVAAVAGTWQLHPEIISNGNGGAYFIWDDDRNGPANMDIYGANFSSTGTALWTANGIQICSAANQQSYPKMLSDGEGGFIVSWQDKRTGTYWDIYAQRVSFSGVSLWPSNGDALCLATENQNRPVIAPGIKPGDCIVFWEDYRSGTNMEVWAQYNKEPDRPALMGNAFEMPESVTTNFVIDDLIKQIDFRFKAQKSITVKTIRVYCNTVNGSPVYDVGIQADNSGNPSGTYLTSTNSTPFSNNWTSYDIPDYTLTAGTVYHVVVRGNSNVNVGAYTSFVYTTPNNHIVPKNQETSLDFEARTTTDGTAWNPAGSPVFALESTTGDHYGNPYVASVVYSLWGTRYSGEMFPGPDTPTNIGGLQFFVRENGVAADNLYYCLYNLTDKVTMTANVLANNGTLGFPAFAWKSVTFVSVTLQPGKNYRVFLYSPGSVDSSNCYQTVTNDDPSLPSYFYDFIGYGGAEHILFSTIDNGLTMTVNPFRDYTFKMDAAAPPNTPTITPTVPPALTPGVDWTLATGNAQFSGRSGTLLLPFNAKMYLIAGVDGASKNDVWSSPDGAVWTQETNSAFLSARSYHAGVVFNNGTGEKMWVMGGVSGPVEDDVWYSSNGSTWTRAIADAAFLPRYTSKALVFDNKMWLIAGRDSGGNPLNDVWSSANGVDWSLVTGNAQFPARFQHEAVAYNGRMYVIGGTDGTTKNDVWSSADGAVWTQETAAAAFGPRRGLNSLTYDDGTGLKMWIYAGLGSSVYFNDVWHSTDGANWIQKTAAANFSKRMMGGACVFNNSMWIVSGSDGVNQNDAWYSGEVVQATATATITPTVTPTTIPCACAGTLGKTNIGGTSMDVSGWIYANRWSVPAGTNINMTKVAVYVAVANAGAKMRVGIFNGMGTAHNILTQSDELEPTVGWNYFTVPETIANAGTDILIGFLTQPGIEIAYDNDASGVNSYISASAELYGLFGGLYLSDSGGHTQYFSAYVDYCPVVCDTATPTITQTITSTVTQTRTQTSTPTNTQFPSMTYTKTVTQTGTQTTTQTVTQTVTQTMTQTMTPTVTETITPTRTPISVNVALGLSNPGNVSLTQGEQEATMLQFSIENTGTEMVVFDGVTFRASGTGDDDTQIMLVYMYEDVNANGLNDGGDIYLGAEPYDSDDGMSIFSTLSRGINSGQTINYILLYWFDAAAVGTFKAEINMATDLNITESVSGSPATIVGAFALNGREVTVVLPTSTITQTMTQTATKTATPTITPTATPTSTGTISCAQLLSFGKESFTANGYVAAVDEIMASKYVLSENGTVDKIAVYLLGVTTGRIKLALYTDNASAPQTLITSSDQFMGVNGWNVIDVPDTYCAAGTYWLAVKTEINFGTNVACDLGAGDSGYISSQSFGSSFSGTFPGGSARNLKFVIKALYCPDSGFTPTHTPSPSHTPTVDTGCASVTFGKTNIGGTQWDSAQDGHAFNASKYVLAQGGTVKGIKLYMDSTYGGHTRVALYTHGTGKPQNLLVESYTQPVINGWNYFPLTPTAVGAGTYWLAFETVESVNHYYDTGAAGDEYYYYSLALNFEAFSTTFPVGTLGNSKWSIYAELCANPTATVTATVTRTITQTVTQTISGTVTQTTTPTVTPTMTQTKTPTGTATNTQTITVTSTPTASETITQTVTSTITPVCGPQGYAAIGSGNTNPLNNVMSSSRYWMQAGEMTGVYVYVSPGTSAGNIQCAVYSDNANNPDVRLAISADQASADGWNALPITYTIPSTGFYWLAFQHSVNGPYFNYEVSGAPANSMRNFTGVTYGTWPANWVGGTVNTALWSLFANVCVNGTVTVTPTITQTNTLTATQTMTQTVTPSETQSATQTVTPTDTNTTTQTNTPTATQSATQTATQTVTPTDTNTTTQTVTPTATQSATQSATQTTTPTITMTDSPTGTVTQTVTPSSSQTNTMTVTQTSTQTNTQTDTPTPLPTATHTQTITQTNTKTVTQTSTLTVTQTNTPTPPPTATDTQTITQTNTKTNTATITQTNTPLPSATDTQTITQTATQTNTKTVTPTATPTEIPASATQTKTITHTATATNTKTVTGTATQTTTKTGTPTPLPPSATLTVTQTVTQTATPLPPSPTSTITQTHTITPTHSITPTPMPTGTPDIPVSLSKNFIDISKDEKINIRVNANAAGVKVKIKVYNLSGELVRRMETDTKNIGWNDIEWDGKNDAGKKLGRGIYFIRVEYEAYRDIKRVYIIK